MKRCFLFLLYVLLVVGCSSDDAVFHNALHFYEDDAEIKTIAFGETTGCLDSVTAFELDYHLDSGASKRLTPEDGKVNIKRGKFKSPYLLIRADFSSCDDDEKEKRPSLYLFLDSTYEYAGSDRTLFYNINVVSSLYQDRTMQLVKEGYPYNAAMELAAGELKVVLGGAFENKYVEPIIHYDQMDAFREDFSDGSMEDSLLMTAIADFVLEEKVEWSDSAAQVFYTHYVEKYLGMATCEERGQRVRITNKLSTHWEDSLVCDSSKNLYPALFDSLDYKMGLCLNQDEEKSVDCTDKDSTCYVCRSHSWSNASKSDWLSFYYHPCDSLQEGDSLQRRDTIFVCRYSSWSMAEIDSLGYALGPCTADNLWEKKEYTNGTFYSCVDVTILYATFHLDPDYQWWQTKPSYELFKERECDENKDSFRVVEIVLGTDTTYYTCAFNLFSSRKEGFESIDKKRAYDMLVAGKMLEKEECNSEVALTKLVYDDEFPGKALVCDYSKARSMYLWREATDEEIEKLSK